MAESRRRMEMRLLRAALWKRRGSVVLAVLAVGIATSVAAALLHLSEDISRKVGRELRAFGPNLLLVPESAAADPQDLLPGAPRRFLDEAAARRLLAREELDGALLLYARARVDGRSIQVIGADLETLRRLHPAWEFEEAGTGAWVGAGLARALDVQPGTAIEVVGTDSLRVPVGDVLSTGGAEDDALWLPLADVQRIAGEPGRASLVQVRLSAGVADVDAIEARLSGDGMRAMALHALSRTEAGLLARMQRLMLLVSIAALVAGGLAAFGTLTDLALARRREIALMKSLGARRRDVVRQFVSESLVIGGTGGVLGWLIGVFFAEFIGRQVFHASIALHPIVPLFVLALALGVALVAGLGPIRLALRVEPAAVLKGE